MDMTWTRPGLYNFYFFLLAQFSRYDTYILLYLSIYSLLLYFVVNTI